LEQLSASEAAVRLAAVGAALQLLDPRTPDGRAVEPIVRALRAEERATEERIAALLLLGRTGAPRAAAYLTPFAAEHNPRRVRLAALRALGDVGVDASALGPVLGALASADSGVRLEAARALRASRQSELLAPLMGLTTAAGQDRAAVISALLGPLSVAASAEQVASLRQLAAFSDPGLAVAIVEALSVVAKREATQALLSIAKDGRVLRAKVAEALAVHGSFVESPEARAEVIAALTVMAKEPDAVVRANAVWALGELSDVGSAKLFEAASFDPDAAVAANATWALSQLPHAAAGQARACAALSDARAYVRANALYALRVWGVRCDGGPELELLRGDPSPVVRIAGARLLRQVALPARADDEAKALQHCARSEASGRVASACAERAEPASKPSVPSTVLPSTVLPSTVFVVPAGYTTPGVATPFALCLGDDAGLRVGLADARGAILVPARSDQLLRLEPPAGTDTP
jgi:HEAT repeat protein